MWPQRYVLYLKGTLRSDNGSTDEKSEKSSIGFFSNFFSIIPSHPVT